MDLKRLTDKAKQAADHAKEAVEKRGGVEGLKDDAARLRDAAKRPGSLKDKAQAAREALAHPDEHEPSATQGTEPPDMAIAPEAVPASDAVDGVATTESREPSS